MREPRSSLQYIIWFLITLWLSGIRRKFTHIMKYHNNRGICVKFCKNKNQLLIMILAVGFFVGIIYENMISKSQGVSIELFQSYFLNQIGQMDIVAEEYLWYVIRARVVPFVMLLFLGTLRWKKTVVCVWVSCTGFLFGMLLVSSVIQLEIKGILFSFAICLPHMIFYVLAYGMYLMNLYRYPGGRWNGTKTVFVVLMMVLGIVLEAYLGPIIIRNMVKIF